MRTHACGLLWPHAVACSLGRHAMRHTAPPPHPTPQAGAPVAVLHADILRVPGHRFLPRGWRRPGACVAPGLACAAQHATRLDAFGSWDPSVPSWPCMFRLPSAHPNRAPPTPPQARHRVEFDDGDGALLRRAEPVQHAALGRARGMPNSFLNHPIASSLFLKNCPITHARPLAVELINMHKKKWAAASLCLWPTGSASAYLLHDVAQLSKAVRHPHLTACLGMPQPGPSQVAPGPARSQRRCGGCRAAPGGRRDHRNAGCAHAAASAACGLRSFAGGDAPPAAQRRRLPCERWQRQRATAR